MGKFKNKNGKDKNFKIGSGLPGQFLGPQRLARTASSAYPLMEREY